MKKFQSIILLIAIALLATSIALFAGDEKSGKKDATKCPMTGKEGTSKTMGGCPGMDASKSKDENCAATCTDKKDKSECKNDSTTCKSKMTKSGCCKEKGSAECKDKISKGDCCKDKGSAECKDKMGKGDCCKNKAKSENKQDKK